MPEFPLSAFSDTIIFTVQIRKLRHREHKTKTVTVINWSQRDCLGVHISKQHNKLSCR